MVPRSWAMLKLQKWNKETLCRKATGGIQCKTIFPTPADTRIQPWKTHFRDLGGHGLLVKCIRAQERSSSLAISIWAGHYLSPVLSKLWRSQALRETHARLLQVTVQCCPPPGGSVDALQRPKGSKIVKLLWVLGPGRKVVRALKGAKMLSVTLQLSIQ